MIVEYSHDRKLLTNEELGELGKNILDKVYDDTIIPALREIHGDDALNIFLSLSIQMASSAIASVLVNKPKANSERLFLKVMTKFMNEVEIETNRLMKKHGD